MLNWLRFIYMDWVDYGFDFARYSGLGADLVFSIYFILFIFFLFFFIIYFLFLYIIRK